ncbi:hypothetical protein IT398_02095 [Candidatus Nomurabacteria bacterium]|nr:hypothetical protein [Candidatus Nomurabacteria bacterium]
MPWYIWAPALLISIVVTGFVLWPRLWPRSYSRADLEPVAQPDPVVEPISISPDFVLVGGRMVCFRRLPKEMNDTEIRSMLSDLGLIESTREVLERVLEDHPNFCPRGRILLLKEDGNNGAAFVFIKPENGGLGVNLFPSGFPRIHPEGDWIIAMA